MQGLSSSSDIGNGASRKPTNISTANSCLELPPQASVTVQKKRQRPPRVITENRRLQNREAQKNYRNKQRKRLQELTELVGKQSQSSSLSSPSNNGTSHPDSGPASENSGVSIRTHGEILTYSKDVVLDNNHENEFHSGTTDFNLNSTIQDKIVFLDAVQAEGAIVPLLFGTSNAAQDIPESESISDSQLDSLFQSATEHTWLNGEFETFSMAGSIPETAIQSIPLQYSTTLPVHNQKLVDSSNIIPGKEHLQASNQVDALSNLTLNPQDVHIISQVMTQKGLTFEDIIRAGLGAITQTSNKQSILLDYQSVSSNSTSDTSSQQSHRFESLYSYLPSPLVTHLDVRRMNLMAACLANAAHIGVNVQERIQNPAGHQNFSPSHFYEPIFADIPLSTSFTAAFYQNIKPDLRPCAAQIQQHHSLYIDVLPFPSFRERILALRSCGVDSANGEGQGQDGMKLFDENEMCRDIDADGLICWGTRAGIGTGVPWDRRSWECAPWFLRKWWMLTGGNDGEMGRQSRWWAEMRGEVFDETEITP